MISALGNLFLLPFKFIALLIEIVGRTLAIFIGCAFFGIGALLCVIPPFIIIGAPICLLSGLLVIKAF